MVKVACCWDDAVVNDIRLMEILRKYNAKATFNINPGLLPEEREVPYWFDPGDGTPKRFRNGHIGIHELYELYKDFPVASHCWKHETVGRCTDEEVVKGAIDARKYLEDLFQKECPGLAWPCGKHSEKTEDMLREAGFTYGRTTAYTTNLLDNTNMMALNSNCHFLAPDFNERFQKAKDENSLFYFWGHAYEVQDKEELWAKLEGIIKMLSTDPCVQWIDVAELPGEIAARNNQ